MKIKMYIFVIGFILIGNGYLFCQVYNNQLYIDDFINISINGKIILKQFYGPPGYGETPKIDSKEYFYVLILDKPIKVIGGGEMVEEIQLSLGETVNENIKKNFSIDKDYNVKGEAMYWWNIHHRTPIVIFVDEIIEIIPK